MIRPETEMKDSGYVWLKQIPKHWTTAKLLYVLRSKISDGPHETPNYVDKGIPFISLDSLNDGKTIDFTGCKRFITEDDYERYSLKTTLEKGDILFSKAASIGKTAIVGDEKFMVWSPLAIIKNNSSIIDNTFLYHLLNCSELIMSITLSGSMNTQINVGMREMEQARIPLPPLSEQQAIADYLDETCSKIDAIIAEAKASIEEYKELKQAVIFEAVTKGLDKNVAMKDSGVEWIGNMPSHWNLVKSTRFITSTQNGMTRRDLDKSSGSIVLKLKNITENGDIDYSWVNRIDLTDKELDTYSLEQDDLLFVRVNGSKSLVGKCAIFEKQNENIAYNDHIIRVKLNDYCSSRFFRWYLLAQSGKTEIALHINTSAGQYTISGQGLRDIYVSLPPLNEQMQIVEYLEEKCLIFDGVIKDKQDMIEDLEAYKKSLIYEVVTGKRRVV